MGALGITFTSIVTCGLSAAIAARSLEAAALSGNQTLVLATAVAAGTFVCAKIGKRVGAMVGFFVGIPASTVTGAGMGGLLGRGEGAVVGGAAGAGLGLMMVFAAAAGGYFGGAYVGHHVAKTIVLENMGQPAQKQEPQLK
jgi:hypothetical protein